MSYVFIGLGANLTPVGYLNPREAVKQLWLLFERRGFVLSRFQIGMRRHLYLSLTSHGI